MSGRFFKRNDEIQDLLRSARPAAPDELVSRLSTRVPTARPRGRAGSRLVLAGAVTALMVVALASVGGISYAATTVSQVVAAVTHHSTFMGKQMSLAVKQTSAATDQYGQSTNAKSFSLGSGSSSSSSSVSIATVNGQSAYTFDVPSSPGSTTVATSVSIPTSLTAGASPSIPLGSAISVDPTPPSAPTSLGDNNAAVSIKLVSNGQVIHPALSTPISVTLHGPFSAQYVPCIDKQDGNGCQATTAISGPEATCPLSNGRTDGYYHSGADIVIETCHLTIFAVVYKGNLSTSQSGRKFAAAGSGKWGDPELISPGKAQLKQVGSVSVRSLRNHGAVVPATFFVNEQASIHLSIFKGAQKIAILERGTRIRGDLIRSGGLVKNFHVTILRPGTVKVQLHVPPSAALVAGQKYKLRVWALDYDGNKTVAYIPFTG